MNTKAMAQSERGQYEALYPPTKGVRWDNAMGQYVYPAGYWLDDGMIRVLELYNAEYLIFRARAPLLSRIAELEDQLETERMRLAACSTAALGYFDGAIEKYLSQSLHDVLALRGKAVGLQEQLAAAEKDAIEQRSIYRKDMLAHCKQAIALIGRHYQAEDFAEIKQLMERTFKRIDANWYDTEKLLKDIYDLPKYSFMLSAEGGVTRYRDSAGNWLGYYEVVNLVDSAREQAAIRGNE